MLRSLTLSSRVARVASRASASAARAMSSAPKEVRAAPRDSRHVHARPRSHTTAAPPADDDSRRDQLGAGRGDGARPEGVHHRCAARESPRSNDPAHSPHARISPAHALSGPRRRGGRAVPGRVQGDQGCVRSRARRAARAAAAHRHVPRTPRSRPALARAGLWQKYGSERVIDTPITEMGALFARARVRARARALQSLTRLPSRRFHGHGGGVGVGRAAPRVRVHDVRLRARAASSRESRGLTPRAPRDAPAGGTLRCSRLTR